MVKDIQTVFPGGHQIVRVVDVARNIINFRFPGPNKSDIILSEFQFAQNNNVVVRVKYSPLDKENLIKSIEVLGVGWKD